MHYQYVKRHLREIQTISPIHAATVTWHACSIRIGMISWAHALNSIQHCSPALTACFPPTFFAAYLRRTAPNLPLWMPNVNLREHTSYCTMLTRHSSGSKRQSLHRACLLVLLLSDKVERTMKIKYLGNCTHVEGQLGKFDLGRKSTITAHCRLCPKDWTAHQSSFKVT